MVGKQKKEKIKRKRQMTAVLAICGIAMDWRNQRELKRRRRSQWRERKINGKI